MEDEINPTRSAGSMDGVTASYGRTSLGSTDEYRPDSTAVMRGIAGSFAREFSSAGTRRLRMPFHLRLSDVAASCFEDFIAVQSGSACCFMLAGSTRNEAAPSRDGGGAAQASFAWLEFSPQIVWGVIAQLLGGHGEVAVPARAFTAIEQRLMGLIAALAGQCLADNLPSDKPIVFSSAITDDAAAAGAAPDEQMIVCKFEAAVGAQAGTVRLALLKKFIDSFDASRKTKGEHKPQAREIRSPIELSVTLDDVCITAEDLENLSCGDLLVTDSPVDGEVQIRLAGIPKFTGQLGAWDDRRAVTIKGGL